MTASTYVRLTRYVATIGESRSGWVEEKVNAFLDVVGAPKVTQEEAIATLPPPTEKDDEIEEIASQHFSF